MAAIGGLPRFLAVPDWDIVYRSVSPLTLEADSKPLGTSYHMILMDCRNHDLSRMSRLIAECCEAVNAQ